MTVKELIERLNELDPEMLVVRDTDWAGQQAIRSIEINDADWTDDDEKVVVLW